MGIRQSVYEQSGQLNYFKITTEEHVLLKEAWSEIESKPQFYGSLFFGSFLKAHPQYKKFFTLEPRLPLNFDVRTTVKFTAIMEGMGYLLLDFYNKPKRLDRLIGYIAMVHKDMRLNRQDMFNFGNHLVEFMVETFPTKMTDKCRGTMSKYMNSILTEMDLKMDLFRNYDQMSPDLISRPLRLPCGQCTTFSNNLIFGQTKFYWDEWKNQWSKRLSEWLAQETSAVDPILVSSTDDEDTSTHRSKAENDTTDVPESLQPRQKLSAMLQHFANNSSRRILPTLAKKLESKPSAISSPESESNADDKKDYTPQDISTRSSLKRQDSSDHMFKNGIQRRQRHRVPSLVRDTTNSSSTAAIIRRRMRTSRIAIEDASSYSPDGREEADSQEHTGEVRKFNTTARERRRENKHYSFDLK